MAHMQIVTSCIYISNQLKYFNSSIEISSLTQMFRLMLLIFQISVSFPHACLSFTFLLQLHCRPCVSLCCVYANLWSLFHTDLENVYALVKKYILLLLNSEFYKCDLDLTESTTQIFYSFTNTPHPFFSHLIKQTFIVLLLW